jgi:GntR family transcriptional regulator
LDIIISNSSSIALYEQIENQIKTQILNGSLKAGDPLPSIRNLAKELKVSIITSKRAYEELEKEGFIQTVVGKGTFVSGANSERLKEAAISEMENKLEEIIISAKALGLSDVPDSPSNETNPPSGKHLIE